MTAIQSILTRANQAALPRKVTEVVLYRLKPETEHRLFLRAAADIRRFLESQPGFISHRVLRDATGEHWVDVVEWSSLLRAEQAAVAAQEAPQCAGAFAMIDEREVTLLHLSEALRA